MLFKIPKTGEIDSSEQSKIDLTLKSAFNLIAILNLMLFLAIIPFLIDFVFNHSLSEILKNYNSVVLIVTFLSVISIVISTHYMFDDNYKPNKGQIISHIITFIFNILWVFSLILFFYI